MGPWIWIVVGVFMVGLLWRRQWALLIVIVCASYGAVTHGLAPSPIRGTIGYDLAPHRRQAEERAHRVSCERRALSALNRGDDIAFARVRRDCTDMIQEVTGPNN